MKVLFIHPNFPAQFRHLARWFGANPEWQVMFATENPRPDWKIPGVEKAVYKSDHSGIDQKSLLFPLRRAAAHAEAVFNLCVGLKKKGFVPDVIYGHTGWGGTWLIREVFPGARFIGYFEWFYQPDSPDTFFDRVEPLSERHRADLRLRNTVMINDLISGHGAIVPTKWQKSQFPAGFRGRLHVVHDGIDTDFFKPDTEVTLDIPGCPLTGREKIVTYATRGMEPYRGFPQFIEALPKIFAEVPDCHAVIAGDDRVCYGEKRRDGKTWKEVMLAKVSLPEDRVHFVGTLPYGKYLRLLQASTVHVYLTRPFVLSWSCLEAMACGCVVVGSDTGPVQEVIVDGENGFLADFHAVEDISSKVAAALQYGSFMDGIRNRARRTICDFYSLEKLLPLQVAFLQGNGKFAKIEKS